MLKEFIRPAKAFGLHGLPMEARLLGQHANIQTYAALFGGRYASKEMILQRIYLSTPKNRKNPVSLSESAACAASHEEIPQDKDIDKLHPVDLMLTKNRKPYWFDNVKFEIWRCFRLSEDVHTNRLPGMPDVACQAARILWQYHEILSGLPSGYLSKCNDDFVSIREILEALLQAASRDPLQRSADCLPEIRFASDYAAHYMPHFLPLSNEAGSVRQRRDRKGIRQILSIGSGNGTCTVDLKIAFTEHYPYRQLGSVRKTSSDDTESDPQSDPGDSVIFTERLVESFLGVIKELLLPDEFNQLTFTGKHLAHELGIRFLHDHIIGDKRFPIDYPSENLHRARKQFRLAYRINAHAAELRRQQMELQLT